MERLYTEAFPTLLDALIDIGANGTRVYLKWSEIERSAPIDGQPPQYSWIWYDGRLQAISEAGIALLVTIADVPTWAADSPCAPIYPDRLDEFARFLTDLVNHYKIPPYNVKYWELINEPDSTWPNSWVGGLGCWGNYGAEYANMLAIAYPAIKNADPNATVLMGGVAHDWFTEYAGPFYRYFPDRVMEAAGGDCRCIEFSLLP
jgi:beta-glucosidase/6-phospho-beta-glucosidase/beta-galactosidase